jgi:hypothetical protein
VTLSSGFENVKVMIETTFLNKKNKKIHALALPHRSLSPISRVFPG